MVAEGTHLGPHKGTVADVGDPVGIDFRKQSDHYGALQVDIPKRDAADVVGVNAPETGSIQTGKGGSGAVREVCDRILSFPTK